MKLTKQQEKEAMKVYETYWDNYLKGDIQGMANLLDDDYTQVGSAETEVFTNKKDAVKFLYDTIDQVAGKLEMRNRSTRLELQDNLVLIHELCDIYVLANDKWVFYSKARASTLMQNKKGVWKFIHQHSSFPDARTGEGENIAIDKIAEENRELREAVKRRTVELEQINCELEIETALEKVRSSALAMKEPSEMVDVCRIISAQLQFFGINNIRNVQTAIINEQKGTYLNYEFYSKHNKTFITEVDYKTHELQNLFAKQMLNGAEELFTRSFRDKEVKDWYAYQKTTNQFADSFLETAESLSYYWYSLGPVALGMSTYSPLNEEEINLFKRFRNVFELTYRRFMDIQQAEAQAREAQIEAALERVRSRTMGMQKSEELKEVIRVVYEQFVHLKINVDHAGFVVDYKPKGDWHFWIADEQDIPSKITHPYFESVWANQFNEANEKGADFFATNLNFEEKNKFYNELLSYVPGLPEASKDFYLSCPGLAGSTVLFDNVSFYIENFSGIPYTDEENNTLMRFGKVFQQTYTRFLDLQKAEVQTREARIETALERVRAVAMAMRKPDELSVIGKTLFTELKELDFPHLRNTEIIINNDLKETVLSYYYSDYGVTGIIEIDYKTNPVVQKWAGDMRKADDAFTEVKIGESEIEEWRAYRLSLGYLPDPKLDNAIEVFYYSYSIGLGALSVSSFEPVSDEQIKILERFRNVFNLSYQRYSDIALAEAQAREAQIELALERARAQSMLMHHSKELDDTLHVFHEQVLLLGIHSAFSFLWLPDEDKNRHIFWAAWAENNSTVFKSKAVNYPLDRNEPATAQCLVDWKSNEPLYSYHVPPAVVENYFAVWQELIDGVEQLKPEYFSGGLYYVEAFMKYGCFGVMVAIDLAEDEKNILGRFAIEFERTYTRFLDLQKAETQAREAQIEASLEKVRTVALSLKKSDEMLDIAEVLYEQLLELGFTNIRNAIIDIHNDKNETFLDYDYSHDMGRTVTLMSYYDDPIIEKQVRQIESSSDAFFEIILEGQNLQDLIDIRLKNGEEEDPRLRQTDQLTYNLYSFGNGAIGISNFGLLSDEQKIVLKRFRNVFAFAYKRYNDLVRAENQAREAQIEAALERVRAKAMSMHSPNDLSETVNVFFKELKILGIIPIRCGVGQIDEETRTTSLTTTTSSQQGESFQVIGKIKQTGHPVLDGIFDHWKLQKEYHPVLEGDDIKAYYNVMNAQIGYPEYPEGATQYGNCFYFKEGFVFAWTESKLSEEELQIFRRFTSVLSLTYRRFLDLKEAEARAFEAARQASLDRIRAEIASMRTSEDLNRITPIIWRELKNLEVPFFRCGVYIIDETQEKVQVYLTTPDGKSLGVLHLSFDSNEITHSTVEHWRKKQVYKEHWNKEKFISWTKSMIEMGQIQNAETYQGSSEPPESLDLHFVPFTQGMLYVGDTSPLSDEKLQLVKTLAEAFSIAYARYEDFKHLEEAKNKIEVTLSELKSAQTQLVHSEKMASLGELTAGIAHEIKNPLNFVNNFSEISKELIDEMKTELLNNNNKEAISIAEDLKHNLEKINQHGKRADSIVKGMLLHSRGSTGEKVLTNINDLLDQYVALAYHGLRAQDKEFNITIEKDYDDSIDKINIVPQDISRVFLNVINNACYAANEKKKKSGNHFSPILKVSTKKFDEKVEIHIRDNGNGIPPSVRENIFNPFFTTKPTGEGTGLGLSLSYDIVVKQHLGEIKFETEESKYTEFIITIPKT